VLDGKYRLVRALGGGGMGCVFEALHEQMGRRVAVKVLKEHLANDADARERFRREALATASLGHPNIVQVTDFGQDEGAAYLVMEFLDGIPLSARLKQRGRLSIQETAAIVAQVLSALEVAHAKGIVHRDLKPDNVFVITSPSVPNLVKLLDFGIAKLASPLGPALTSSGVVLGTPTYMAPEQAQGRAVDHRVDLYAVGCLMYEALTGGPPFSADNYNALLFAIANGQPVPVRSSRPDLEDVLAGAIERALAKDPDARFPSAAEMRRIVEQYARPSQLPPRMPTRDAPASTVELATGPTGLARRMRPSPAQPVHVPGLPVGAAASRPSSTPFAAVVRSTGSSMASRPSPLRWGLLIVLALLCAAGAAVGVYHGLDAVRGTRGRVIPAAATVPEHGEPGAGAALSPAPTRPSPASSAAPAEPPRTVVATDTAPPRPSPQDGSARPRATPRPPAAPPRAGTAQPGAIPRSPDPPLTENGIPIVDRSGAVVYTGGSTHLLVTTDALERTTNGISRQLTQCFQFSTYWRTNRGLTVILSVDPQGNVSSGRVEAPAPPPPSFGETSCVVDAFRRTSFGPTDGGRAGYLEVFLRRNAH
jgi:serine/threonine-protein kinase